MIRLVTSLFLALLLVACGPPPSLPEIPPITTEAFEPIVRADILDALAAVDRRPHSVRSNSQLGMKFHAYHLFAQAEIAYRRVRLLDRRSARWAYYHADVLLAVNRYDDALTALRDAIALDPGYSPAKARLAGLLINIGSFAESAKLLDEILSEDPEHAEALYETGRLRTRQGKLQDAIDAFERSLAITGPDAKTYFGIADSYRRLGRPDLADRFSALHRKFIRKPPQKWDPLLARVSAMNRSSKVLLDRAAASYAADETDIAIGLLMQALEQDPDNVAAHTALVGIFARTKQFDLADRHYDIGSGLTPTPALLHLNLATARTGEQRWVEAAELVERALAVDPQMAGAYAQMGIVRLAQGRRDEAMIQFRLALEIDPNLLNVRERLAQSLIDSGRHRDAVEVLAYFPAVENLSTARLLTMLASAHEHLGQRREAIDSLQRAQTAIATHPTNQLTLEIQRRLNRLKVRLQETEPIPGSD